MTAVQLVSFLELEFQPLQSTKNKHFCHQIKFPTKMETTLLIVKVDINRIFKMFGFPTMDALACNNKTS